VSDDPINPITEEIEALDRIARTWDGRLLHRYLRRILESAYDFQKVTALRTHNGRRTLARDLMGHMAAGIEGTSGRRDEHRGDEPILNRSTRAASGVHRRPAGARRVDPDPAVAEFLLKHGPDKA
jgi:hypothetical protein